MAWTGPHAKPGISLKSPGAGGALCRVSGSAGARLSPVGVAARSAATFGLSLIGTVPSPAKTAARGVTSALASDSEVRESASTTDFAEGLAAGVEALSPVSGRERALGRDNACLFVPASGTVFAAAPIRGDASEACAASAVPRSKPCSGITTVARGPGLAAGSVTPPFGPRASIRGAVDALRVPEGVFGTAPVSTSFIAERKSSTPGVCSFSGVGETAPFGATERKLSARFFIMIKTSVVAQP